MFSINFQSRVPVYQQICDNIIRLVSYGAIKSNERLPAVRRMATDLGVNPNTVAKAYSMLESSGYVYTVTGKGSFISEKLQNGEARRIEMKNQLREKLKEAYSVGLSPDDISEIINEIYYGGEEND